MAKSVKNKIDVFLDENIIPQNLEEIIGDRFGKYSKYIIQDRALPDVRDGLKPVQRRILFAMDQLGMASNKPYKKSARIVGEVIGKYHPHGDTSVYDAMVRMSQDWKSGTLLIDMHGNNGSIDNDPAAAMRYTEARLTPYAELLLKDIEKRTVSFIPNFDDEEYEPIVLPAKFPNLLVNGSMGMATGYATNIPPHNLNEVIEAVIYKIQHPSATVDEIAEIIKGPDFPTGAIVEGVDEIKKAFETGRGRIILRSKVEVSETQIVITEIPYEVNKADLVRKIDDIRLKKKIDGIIEVRDESDREGLRIAIDIKKEISSEVVLSYLLKNTDLLVSYNYNMVAIDQKSPKLLSIINILDSYIQHQKEVIRNRSNYELLRAEKRKHIVEGFLKMVDVLDEVIHLIRASLGKKDAIMKLMEHFDFSDLQADAIVSLQLYRLSTTDVLEMQKEHNELQKTITLLNRILNNEKELEKVIINELQDINQQFPTPRKSQILQEIRKLEIDEQELIENENVMVVLSKDGYIKRSSLKSYQATNGETGLKQDDLILKHQEVNTRNTLLIFTSLGNYINLPVYKIPDMKYKEIGDYIGIYAPLLEDETLLDFLVISDFEADSTILLANQEGQVKQVAVADFQQVRLNKTYSCIPASRVNKMVSVDLKESFDTSIVCVSRKGYILKYDLTEVPLQSLSARGVKGMNLREDELIGAKFATSINKDEALLLTNRGGLKREFISNFETGHRPAKGKLYLKSVKTNPYEFVGFMTENIFRLKEYLTIRITTEKSQLVIPAEELKPDKYEHGIPYLEKEQMPVMLLIDKDNQIEAHKILEKLAQEKEALPDKEEEIVLEEELKEDIFSELEKILATSPSKEDLDDEDDEETIIQQTLF